jgi:hypothetical protein
MMGWVDPGIIAYHVDYTLYLDEDHLSVFVARVHQEEIKAVNCVSIWLPVEDSDNASVFTVKVVKSGLNEVGLTPGWVAV